MINFDAYIANVESHRRIRIMALTKLKEYQIIYPSIVNRIYEEQFGSADFDEIVKIAEKNNYQDIFNFKSKVEEAIELERSYIDVYKLKHLLQNKDGIAFQAFTDYTCKICGKEDRWHNGNTPTFCDECAEKIAIRIARNADKILKEQ